MFERHSSMANAAITNYIIDATCKYLILLGVIVKVCWVY